ncbi:MAG: glycosyltransferase family 4 protein [bacterium]
MSARVLFVHTTQGDRLTGGPRMIRTLLAGLRGGVIEPCLVTQRESDLTRAVAADGVAVRVLSLPRSLDVFGGELARPSALGALRAAGGLLAYDGSFAALLAEMQPAAVWATNLRTMLTVAAACRRARVPLVWNVWLGQRSTGVVRVLNDVAIGAAARIVTEYEAQAAEIFRKAQLSRARPKLRAVYTGHAAPPPPAPRRRAPGDRLVVGTLGALSPRKDPQTFVEMAAQLARDVPAACFVIGGDALPEDASYRDELRKVAYRHGLGERLELAGWIEDPWAFLARLDVYVQTSRAEGLPGAVREAMAMGLPVVATDVGGTKEAVAREVTGFLAPAGDAPALAAGVARIARDPELAARLGEAGRRRFERLFSSDAFVANMRALFEELVRRPDDVTAPRPLPSPESATRPSRRPVPAPASAPRRTS